MYPRCPDYTTRLRMRHDALQLLQEELRASPPEELAVLSDGQLRALAAAVHRAREQQSAALDDATEAALKHVPRTLRATVRRILG